MLAAIVTPAAVVHAGRQQCQRPIKWPFPSLTPPTKLVTDTLAKLQNEQIFYAGNKASGRHTRLPSQ